MPGGDMKNVWDGQSTPSSLHQVWSYLGRRLREIREHIDEAQESFYDKEEDRIGHLSTVNDALQTVKQIGRYDKPICSYIDIEQLLQISPGSVIRPKLLTGAQEILRPFLERLKDAIQKAESGKNIFEEEILENLEIFCSNYMKLNNTDDKYYEALRAKALSVRQSLANFDRILTSLRNSSPADQEWYCNDSFSRQVSDKFKCDQVPILRVIPDLIQKFENVYLVTYDWLRSDKVYMAQLEQQIGDVKSLISDTGSKTEKIQKEFNKRYEMLRQRKIELEDFDISYDTIWREITQLEARKTQLEIEIHTVAKTLKNCRQLIEELKNEPDTYDMIDSVAPEYDDDMDDMDEVDNAIHFANTSYRTKLSRDARGHTVRLNYLRKKRKQLERNLTSKNLLLQDIETNESEVQQINKKLRIMAKNNSKKTEEIGKLQNKLDGLEQMLYHRLNPTAGSRANSFGKPQLRPRCSSFGRQRVDSFGRSRMDSFGRSRRDSFGRSRMDSFSIQRTRTNSIGKRLGSIGQRTSSFGKRTGSISFRQGSISQRTSSFSRVRAGSVTKSHTPKDSTGGLYLVKKRIADIQKAFRLVKNRIGLNWKDLARSLPYDPVKDIHEIDQDIKEIEYEYRGELKEQAYQSLVRWYSHSGRSASVDILWNTLKEIKEVRLAEEIQTAIIGQRDESVSLQGVKEECTHEHT